MTNSVFNVPEFSREAYGVGEHAQLQWDLSQLKWNDCASFIGAIKSNQAEELGLSQKEFNTLRSQLQPPYGRQVKALSEDRRFYFKTDFANSSIAFVDGEMAKQLLDATAAKVAEPEKWPGLVHALDFHLRKGNPFSDDPKWYTRKDLHVIPFENDKAILIAPKEVLRAVTVPFFMGSDDIDFFMENASVVSMQGDNITLRYEFPKNDWKNRDLGYIHRMQQFSGLESIPGFSFSQDENGIIMNFSRQNMTSMGRYNPTAETFNALVGSIQEFLQQPSKRHEDISEKVERLDTHFSQGCFSESENEFSRIDAVAQKAVDEIHAISNDHSIKVEQNKKRAPWHLSNRDILNNQFENSKNRVFKAALAIAEQKVEQRQGLSDTRRTAEGPERFIGTGGSLAGFQR